MSGRKTSIADPFAHLLRGRRRRTDGSLKLALREVWLGIRACAAGRDHAFEMRDSETLRKFLALQASLIKVYSELRVPTDLEARVIQLEAERARARGIALGSAADDDDDEMDDDLDGDEDRD